MDELKRKQQLKETFDTVSGGYDGKALRFFPASAGHLASFLALSGDEHVLDVATGTGHAALAVAACLPHGRATGVDFSPGMLDQARSKAAALNIRNVEFLEGDMQNLIFPAGSFDAAVCAFGIFFVDDMIAQLARIAEVVRPRGRVAITGFQENLFGPLASLFFDHVGRYGVQPPTHTWKRIATEAGCRELFEKAGLADVQVERKNVGYFLDSAEEWWDIVWNAGFRRMVVQIRSSEQERFRREHLQEVAALRTKDGIWLDVGVMFAMGTKP